MKNQLTVLKAQELFVMSKSAEGMAEKTLRDYKRSSQHFIDEMNLANTPLEAVTKQTITEWVLWMVGQNKKPVTQNKYLRDVRVFLYWCFEEFNLPPFKIKCVKAQEPPIKGYSNDELKQLMKPIKKTDYNLYRSYCIVAFILSTGARANTLLNVKVSDIDFTNRTVFYAQTKNKYSQNVPLSDSIVRLLREYIAMWRTPEDYLFGQLEGEMLSLSGLENALRKFVAYQGCEWHSIHGFRHSFAREYIKNGGSAFNLQTLLGHSDISVTKKYCRLYGRDIDITPAPFDQLINK